MSFKAASTITGSHLIVQPADARLNPPESYFYVQDGLMIACGSLYALCYFFYSIRTYKDRVLAGRVEYLSTTMAYELYYAFTITTTSFEFWLFLVWFLFDVTFVTLALISAYPRNHRSTVALRTGAGVVAGIALLNYLCKLYPDDRQQVTAFWTGIVLQFPISWESLFLLLKKWDTRGHSLEIWVTRCLGCWTAYGLFYWRYINIPQNWAYVGSPWSVGLIGLTLLAEAVYPFVYVYVWKHGDRKLNNINKTVEVWEWKRGGQSKSICLEDSKT